MDRYNLLSSVNNRLPAHQQLAFYVCRASLVIDSYDVNRYTCVSSLPKEARYKWVEHDRHLEFTEWFDVDGYSVFVSADIDQVLDNFTKVFDWSNDTCEAIDLLKERSWNDNFKEQLCSPSGSEGMNKIRTYSKNMLVMWPKKFEFDILIGFLLDHDINWFFETFELKNQTIDAKSHKKFTSIIDFMVIRRKKNIKSHRFNLDRFITDSEDVMIYKLLQKFNDPDLAEKYIKNVKPPITFKNSSHLAKLVVQFGHDRLDQCLGSICSQYNQRIVPICNFVLVILIYNYIQEFIIFLI